MSSTEPTPEPTAETAPAPGGRPGRRDRGDAVQAQQAQQTAQPEPAPGSPAVDPAANPATSPEAQTAGAEDAADSGEVLVRTLPWRTFRHGERLIVPQGTKVPAGELDDLFEAAQGAGQTLIRD